MRLIGLAVILALSLSLAFQGSEAQQPQKMPRLCFLTFDPPKARRFDPFFQRLRELGYVDGQTIAIDYLSAEGQGDRFPALAGECLRRKADIIVVTTTPAALAAKSATSIRPPASTPSLTGNIVGSRFFAARSTRRLRSLMNISLGSTARALARALVMSEKALSKSRSRSS
jgi:hypothetical protein